MKFSDAKMSAEVESTEKSRKFRKTAQRAIIAVTTLIMLFVLTFIVARRHGESRPPVTNEASESTKIPLASTPVAQWPKIVLPPGGKSERIPVPQGMRVAMDGEDFRFHCVYRDGHEESFGKREESCPNGDMPFVYAMNGRKKEPNIVSYAYAPL